MSYKCALGNLPVKRKKNIKDPPIKLPEEIKLRDGRVFPLKEILKKPTDKEYYDLRNKQRKPTKKVNQQKYFHEDWVWMSNNSIEDIMARYTVDRTYANILRNKGHKAVKLFDE
jgi:hypothetical protein